MFLNSGSVKRRLAFLHWLQLGVVRQLRRYYQDALTSCRPSHLASLPPLGGTSVALVVFAPRRTSAPPKAWSWSPGISSRVIAEETTGSPKFLGNPNIRLHMFFPTPAGLLAPDHYGVAAWPLVCEQQRLPRKVFRRSIAWLSDSLSTLRRAGRPNATQDSLPAVGQTLLDGLSTRRVPTKGFELLPYISSSLPKLCLAQAHRPLDSAACHGYDAIEIRESLFLSALNGVCRWEESSCLPTFPKTENPHAWQNHRDQSPP